MLHFSHKLWYCCLVVTATLQGIASTTTVKTPFQPSQPTIIAEEWRWSILEALEDYFIFTGDEDSDDRLWLASKNEIVIYDGHTIQTIPYPRGPQDQEVYDILVIGNDRAYIHTNNGLLHYRSNEWRTVFQFTSHFPNDRHLFTVTSDGSIFAACHDGVYKLKGDEATKINTIRFIPISIVSDVEDNLWVSTRMKYNIIRIPTENGQPSSIEQWTLYPCPEEQFLHSFIFTNDEKTDIWLGNGYMDIPNHRLNPITQQFERVPTEHMSVGHSVGVMLNEEAVVMISKSSSSLQYYRKGKWENIEINLKEFPWNGTYMFKRKNGNLIIGGRGENLIQLDLTEDQWITYQHIHFQCEDLQKRKWFLSVDGEIVVQETDGTFNTWKSSNIIDTPNNIICSRDGTIWISGSHQHVAAVSYFNGETWTLDTHPRMNVYFSHLSAKELENEEIWFGSGYEFASEIGGLTKYRKENGVYTFSYVEPPEVPSRISGIVEISPNEIYFGGLEVSRYDNTSFEPITLPDLPSIKWFDHMTSDDSGNLWLAVWQYGLVKWNSNEWELIKGDSLARNQVTYLQPDTTRTDALWVATQKGLSYFDGQSWIPNAMPDAVLTREGGTLRQTSDGAIWINKALREWYFRKDNSDLSDRLNQRFETIRYLPDREAPAIELSAIKTHYIAPANLYISWDSKDPWGATASEEITFSWKINGGDWSPFTNENEIMLLDQKPGSYVIRIQARDLSGNRSKVVKLPRIKIIPPLWQRTWFVALLILSTVTLITLIALLIRLRIRQIVQFEEFKLQFFTNMSHELRTPMTVIIGPLQQLLKRIPEGEERKPVELAFRNARKMMHTIEQILAFRKMEFGKDQLHAYEGDVVQTIKESIELVQPLADGKSQQLTFTCNTSKHIAKYDADKLTKIIDNLVSNSIKYTPSNGNITITANIQASDNNQIILTVEDDGPGIPKAKLSQIFKPFYRARDQKNFHAPGTGLGLALTKYLIDICKGTIEVESPIFINKGNQKGTRFTITIPLIESQASENTVIGDDQANASTLLAPNPSLPPQPTHDKQDAPLILFVEDDADIRELIATEFNAYNIEFAETGVEGFEIAKVMIPDLIVSDVIMEGMSGLKLCSAIREHPTTNHIPVILLTALKGEDNEMAGWEHGADDYITKPFDIGSFSKRIETLLKNRQIVQQKLESSRKIKNQMIDPLPSDDPDQDFLKKAQAVTLHNLENPLFDIQSLADELNMSRMTLYRKFKTITGDTPADFVKRIRMKIAANLLLDRTYNIGEVAEKVGLPVPAQFTTAFKKQFNCTPSQYIKRQKRK